MLHVPSLALERPEHDRSALGERTALLSQGLSLRGRNGAAIAPSAKAEPKLSLGCCRYNP